MAEIQLTPEDQTIVDRHMGRCMERIERLRIEPVDVSIIRDIIRKELRFLAENIAEAHDGIS
jgi:uncharacterized protein (UPF0335 family)